MIIKKFLGLLLLISFLIIFLNVDAQDSNVYGDLKINGSDGPINLLSGQIVTVSWSGISNCNYATWEQRNRLNDIIEGPRIASIPAGSDSSLVRQNAAIYTLTCHSSSGPILIDSVRLFINSFGKPPRVITLPVVEI